MKLIIRLVLGIVVVTTSAVASDEGSATRPREIPAKLDSSFKPEIGMEYSLAAGLVYHRAPGSDPGPAERDTSMAWAFANEFVYRTALSKDYSVPAGSAGPGKDGWFEVGFTSKDGKSRLVVEVNVARHVARLPQPKGQPDAPANGRGGHR
jgi:hypothetical protein